MEFKPDFVEKIKLTPEQVTALVEATSNHEAEIKKTYDGKANTDAENILDGAVKSVAAKTGIQREQGMKVADYITLAAEKHVEGKLASERSALEKKQAAIEEQIRTGTPDGALKMKLDAVQQKLDALQQKEAEYDRVATAKFEELYNQVKNENQSLKIKTAFNAVKPVFPDTVNKYEAAVKWNDFESSVKLAYDIDFDENDNPIAVSKDNKHKVVKLVDLLSKSEEITKLLTGRNLIGTGAAPAKEVMLKGVPFAVPENATPAARQKAIKDYLATIPNLSPLSREWADQFADFNRKLLEGTPATT